MKKYIKQYADKYYLLDIKKDYKNNKTFAIIYDKTTQKEKRAIIRKNGYLRINGENIAFYSFG